MNDMKEALRECHELGYLTDRFSIMAIEHARIQINKKHNTPFEAREEAVSDFAFKLVKSWERLSPDKSPFSYLTMMASSCFIDMQRRFDKRRRKIERVKNEKTEVFYEVFNNVTPCIDLKRMKLGNKSIIRRQVIQQIKKGVTKSELSRVTGIPRRTLIRWHQSYIKYGTKFYAQDRRSKNRRPFKK